MIPRLIEKELAFWKEKQDRKPLILRGARQVGKTTLVRHFSKQFKNYIEMNLDLDEDRALLEGEYHFEELVQVLFFQKNVRQNSGTTLIFIDEIQNSSIAIKLLRYFYEKSPELYVIAAGSLLETAIDVKTSFPVGRVEYLVLRPLAFKEFLYAIEETVAAEALESMPAPSFIHEKMLALFHEYALIGGMPNVVQSYAKWRDPVRIGKVYEDLIAAYLDDVEKYARSRNQISIIRHAIRSIFYEAGNRIKFHGFGQSNYSSREMGEALKALEKALLIQLIYPTVSPQIPLAPNLKKSPKLQVFDTGLVNYFSGIQQTLLGNRNLNAVHPGTVAEHIVGQELLATNFGALSALHFWVREKKQSNAEVDFIIKSNGLLIPIEVKSGATGRLRSLHQFMDEAQHPFAIRLCSEAMQLDSIKTIQGKPFFLLSLPYYLAGELGQYASWFQKEPLPQ